MTSPAVEVINIGAYPNDATGDPIRTAFTKINQNFQLFSGTLAPFTPTTPGLVPASGGGTATALRADGQFTSTFSGSWTFPTLNSTTVNAGTVEATDVTAATGNIATVNATTINAATVNTTTYNVATVAASSQVTIAGEPAYDAATGTIGYYALTAYENIAGLTVASHAYPFLDSRRYAFDLTGNAANGVANAALLTAVCKAGGLAAAATGQTQTVSLYPGLYCITRAYINYSNVYIQGYGATILQTKTGITNSQATGTTPAYAIIHINPLSYTVNPGSPVTAINNVQIFGNLTVQGPYVEAQFTGSLSGTTLTVTGISAGSLVVGMPIFGSSTVFTLGTAITAFGSGSGGTGTYTINNSQSAASQAMLGFPIYDQYALGIVANDCNQCWVEGISLSGCGGENILLNPSGWNTCYAQRINRNIIIQGGEVGINNARCSELVSNYYHDNWSQNGLGGDGDGIIVRGNHIHNMFGAALTFGGSGARDINATRNVILECNEILNTNIGGPGYAIFGTDDGATTTPKTGIRVIGNICNLNNSGTGSMMGFDFNIGDVDVEHNTLIGGVSAVSTAGIAIIAGNGNYNLRDNTFKLGSGNMEICMDVLGGSPTVNVWSYCNIDIPNDFQPSHINLFNVIDTQRVLTGQLTLTGLSTLVQPNYTAIRRNKLCFLTLYGSTVGPSNATTLSISGLPAEITPVTTGTQGFEVFVTSHGTPQTAPGLMQITSGGVINFYPDGTGAAWTNDGLGKGLTGPITVAYQLN